ncbi:hypothetical protein H0O00_01420 [Candidatus Micrarchaeota archaeon]|nr:hypothetical protein [Candidatus Micrarchaeota archaeon]
MDGYVKKRSDQGVSSQKAAPGTPKKNDLRPPLAEGPAPSCVEGQDAKRPGKADEKERATEVQKDAKSMESPENGPVGLELTREEIVEYAQMTITENKLRSMEQLGFADPDITKLVLEIGAGSELRFISEDENMGAAEPGAAAGKKDGANGNGHGARKENALSEGGMYRKICAECFGIGTATRYVGGKKGSVKRLQSSINRRLQGPLYKLFRKCWDQMVSEGAIDLDRNRDSASLIPSALVRDEKLKGVLDWAQKQHLASIGVRNSSEK